MRMFLWTLSLEGGSVRVPSFVVENQRSVRLARCEQLPRLMIIAGPNGSGKSTLLNGVRSYAGHDNIMYVGPHRAMRKQTVRQRHLLSSTLSFELLLSSQHLQGIEGIQIFDGERDPWGYDESANYLKHALCQIEVDRLQAIGNRLDREGEILKGSLVDPWTPLRELLSSLLPHLQFERIDTSNRDQVKVLFRVHLQDALVDLDDLSSGEKSIIQMFYPLVEREIRGLVQELDIQAEPHERPELCVLIDEPELHLHPTLQLKVLEFMRDLTSRQSLQVIVATHSPTIVEGASFEELYLLRPPELVSLGENQLIRVADDEDRLSALRTLFGTTHNLTSMQPVIVVEGATDRDAGQAVADSSVYRALHRGFDRATLISAGGKREAARLARALRSALLVFSSRLRVVAVLDQDLDEAGDDIVKLLPVSMMENFLIDPDVLFVAIQSVMPLTSFRSLEDVANALDAVLADLETDEINRRTANALGASHFHPPGDPERLTGEVEEFVANVREKYSEHALQVARDRATESIAAIRVSQRRREHFDGKKVLKEFNRRHLHSTGLSHRVFTFYAAQRARDRRSVMEFFDRLFREIENTPRERS